MRCLPDSSMSQGLYRPPVTIISLTFAGFPLTLYDEQSGITLQGLMRFSTSNHREQLSSAFRP